MVQEVFNSPQSKLNSLLQKAGQIEHLQKLIHSFVDPDLATRFQVAAVRKNRLIIITPTASWATRLRMQASQIIDALHNAGVSNIEHIDIRVAPLVEQVKEQKKPKPLSPAAKQALQFMAQLESDDEK